MVFRRNRQPTSAVPAFYPIVELPREEFISQFAIPFHVHCLKLWSRRATAPPYAVSRCCFERIGITNGTVSLESNQFTELVRPVIDDLYRNTPAGKRPDANVLAAKIYDALDAARVEVTIRQPPGASGGGKR